MNLSLLKTPFASSDIEWRIAERGKKGDGAQWAKVLAYITNRAIMERLDEVCGQGGWRNEFQHLQGAFLCGIGIKIGDEWVTKWDGAQESQIEATKGGISGAMKRAAVQWGIGRYLYNLDAGWADIKSNGKNYAGRDQKKSLDAMKWDAPALPKWALPEGTPQSPPPSQDRPFTVEADLKDCKTIDELKKVFSALSKEDQHKYVKVKDEVKIQIVKNVMK